MNSRASRSPLRIESAEVRIFRVPPAVPWADATHHVTDLELLTLRLATADGVIGTGFAYTVGIGITAVQAMLEDYCIASLYDADFWRFEELWSRIREDLRRTGSGGTNSLALAAIDIAGWDLRARMLGLDVATLLGGCRSQAPAYLSSIDSSLGVPDLVARARMAVDRGYRGFKMKVGGRSPHGDAARVASVRDEVGPEFPLFLDANQSWSVDEAPERVALLAPHGPAWIEEPFDALNIEAHAHLRAAAHVCVAVGESLYSKEEFVTYIQAKAADVLQPDIARVGGYTEARRIADLASAHGLRLAPHYLPELSTHLVCGVANGWLVEDVLGGSLPELELSPAKFITGGVASPPASGVGHGISLDEAGLVSREVDRATVRVAPRTVVRGGI